MELIRNLLQVVDIEGRWIAWLSIAADIALALACTAFLGLIIYFAFARNELPAPTFFWLLTAYLGCTAFLHVASAAIIDQSRSDLVTLCKVFIALIAWLLFIAAIRLVPNLGHLAVLSKQNSDLLRELERLRASESSLQQHVTELERVNAELEYVSRGVVGREERILELKREINHLLQRVGEQPRYRAAMDLPV